MQTVKEKLSDMKEMRKVKAEARAEEQAERELAKARLDIAHEVRLAREAEGTMDLHVAKAGEKAEREIAKHTANHNRPHHPTGHQNVGPTNDPHGQSYTNNPTGSTTAAAATTARASENTATTATGLENSNTTNTGAAPPQNNLLPPDFNIFTSK